jgi:hypothetical protein
MVVPPRRSLMSYTRPVEGQDAAIPAALAETFGS